MKRALLYGRVSTDEQGKGYSLPTQMESLRKYAEEKGYIVAREFTDMHTGTELDRPGLNDLCQYVKEEGAEKLVVYDIDRLSREVGNQAIIEMEMAHAGVEIEYVLGGYDKSPEGELMKIIKAGIAQYENRQRVERSRRGKAGRARAGYVIGTGARAPYGYDYISEPHKGWFVINEREAEVVRKIFSWLVDEGLSAYKIAHRLWQQNILTKGDYSDVVHKKGVRGAWNPGTITRIIRHSVYKGVWYYGKTRRTKVKGKTVQIKKPKSEWIAVPVPAIVDEETWNRAQECLRDKKVYCKRNAKRQYLLRGLVFCPCGRRWVGMYKTHLKRSYYRCPANESQTWLGLCNHRFGIRQKILEKAVWEKICSLLLDSERLKEEIANRRAEARKELENRKARLDAIDSAIAEVDRKMGVLLEQVLTGGFAQSVIDQKTRELSAQRSSLEGDAARLSVELKAHTITAEQEIELDDFAEQVRESLGEQTYETKRRVLELLRIRVDVISRDQVKLSGVVTDGLIVTLSSA